MYRRWYRRWVSALLIACLTAPGLVIAQDRRDLPKLGALWVFDPSTAAPYVRAFKEALRERGWIDGRTIQIIERYDNNDPARRQIIAEEVVALQVDLLHVNDAILPAARKASQTIPMVCPDFYDPIEEGFTTSLARPDGNVTGMSWQTIESAIKRLQLTRELVPRARRIGWLFDTTDPGAAIELRGIVAAARVTGVTIEKFEFRTSADAELQLARLKGAHLDALIVPYSVWPVIDRIIQVATANRLPVISEPVEFARAGSVMTYGPDTLHMIRRSAYLVDALLKGASPADLPIEQPTWFHLTVSLKAAQALGITIPVSIMQQATEVIR